MTSIITSEAIKAASNAAAPIVTPISSIISGATAAPTPVAEASATAATATSTTATSTAATATSIAQGEKLILGISQRNFFIGAGVLGVVGLAATGAFIYKKVSSVPKQGMAILLDRTNVSGMCIGIADGKKLTHQQKKDAKELVKAINGLEGTALTSDLLKVAQSAKPELMGISLEKFPSTNILFQKAEDRAGFGAALVYQAIYRASGYPTILEYDSTGDRPCIRVIPVVKGEKVTAMGAVDVRGLA